MKTKKSKLLAIFLLLLPLFIVILGAGCDTEDEYSNLVEGFVVGSFIGDGVDGEGQATGNKTERGYCILLVESEDKAMSFYSFNFSDTLFAFPDEILLPDYNGYNCGPTFFPDSLKFSYKIKFKYQIVDEPDKVQFSTGPCTTLALAFPWENYNQIFVNETTKN
jgi:hypothetical protein